MVISKRSKLLSQSGDGALDRRARKEESTGLGKLLEPLYQTKTNHRNKSLRVKGLGLLAGCTALLAGGCLGPEARPIPTRSAGTRMQMVGDWDDVGPAALVAASQCEMAIVRWPETVPGSVREMELVTACDEPAELRFETSSGTDPRPIEVLCKVGTYGDIARERELLDRVNQRLEQLKGKDWAPIEP